MLFSQSVTPVIKKSGNVVSHCLQRKESVLRSRNMKACDYWY